MKWVIEQLNKGYVNNEAKGRSQHTKQTRHLKYCKQCKLVFQKDTMYKVQTA
jgi:hypothetical protein